MIKILLADADEEFRILLNDTINAETDMEVVGSVGDGNEALELINAGGVDVLVMDLVLSGMDGLELLHKIGDVGGRRPTILVVSGFTRGNVVNQSAALGADFFLTKPCRLDSVTERIRLLRLAAWSPLPAVRIWRLWSPLSFTRSAYPPTSRATSICGRPLSSR